MPDSDNLESYVMDATASPCATRYERWKQFHFANPEVYRLFKRFAREARRSRERFGARAIWERLRWYTAVETTDADYKLNDHYTPYYARLLMLECPSEFDGFFERRDERFDATDADIVNDVLRRLF